MSHYLFALWDGAGNVPPAMSVARALIDRGHRVTTIADPTVADEVRAAGAAFVPWTGAPHRSVPDPRNVVVPDWDLGSPLDVLGALRDGLICGPAERFAADVDTAIADLRPDAVVVDEMLLGAAVAAEASDLPWATVMPNLYFLPAPGRPPFGPGFPPAGTDEERMRDDEVARMSAAMWAEGLPPVNAARARRGLSPLADPLSQLARAHRVLVLSSRAFDYPACEFPENVRHVGPRLDDPSWAAEGWRPPAGEDPLVLVSLSSSFQDQEGVLRRIARALADLPVRALVTTGPCIDPASVPAAPNVSVVACAAHSEVLPHAAAVVTHAGHGTLMKALAHGLPVLCMPMGRDQEENATRVAVHGCGERLSAGAEAGEIRGALERILTDPAYRVAAGRMAAAIEGDLAEDRALAELERLAATAPLAVPARV